MDNALRLQYLEAMGIDVWVPRQRLISDSVVADDQQDMAGQALISAGQCDLCDLQVHALLGVGNQQADWLLVVEATSADEVVQGLFFEEPAGLLLTEMLRAIDLSCEEVFIAPLVECKTFDLHGSSMNGTEYCTGHLLSQQQLIQPKIILAVGDKAAQTLLKTPQSLESLRGRCHYSHEIPVVVIEHPANLLRSLLEKRHAWQDLCFAKQIINNEGKLCVAG